MALTNTHSVSTSPLVITEKAPGLHIGTYPGVTAALQSVFQSFNTVRPWEMSQGELDSHSLVPWSELGGEQRRDSFISTASVPTLCQTWGDDLALLNTVNQGVMAHYISQVPALQTELDLSLTVSAHAYRCMRPDTLPTFSAHKDFGLIACAFTLGNGYEYYQDGAWHELFLEEDQFIINFGMYAQCLGLEAILHRVLIPDGTPLNPRYSKFTMGFFNDVHNPQHLDLDLSTVAGQRMKAHFSSPDDYLTACLSGKVDVSGDGPLPTA